MDSTPPSTCWTCYNYNDTEINSFYFYEFSLVDDNFDLDVLVTNANHQTEVNEFTSTAASGLAIDGRQVTTCVTEIKSSSRKNTEVNPVNCRRKTEQFAILWLLFFFIVFGNSAVLAALQYGKKPKSRMNFFIMQLALADLCVGLLYVLTDIIWRSTVAWKAGNIACKVIRFSQAVVTFSSTYVLVALSIDRYYAIKYPMNFCGSWRRARILVISAWSISFVLSIPIAILYNEQPVQGRTQCWIDFPHPWQWQVYMTCVAVALFVVPAIIISICYAFIVFTIWAKGRQYTQQATSDDTRRASSRGIIPQAKVKTVKMTFIIVLVFILCWSPYIVFDLLQVYGLIPRTQTNIAIASLIQSLAPLNSAANPLIYCLFSSSKTTR